MANNLPQRQQPRRHQHQQQQQQQQQPRNRIPPITGIYLLLIGFIAVKWAQSAAGPGLLDAYSRINETCSSTPAPVKNVAIIGAGAAGSSTAYHLRHFSSPCHPVNLTVFERRHYVGGRSTTVNIFDSDTEPVELGASIFVPVNHILVQTTADLGLRIKDDDQDAVPLPPFAAGADLAVWDGSHIRFSLPRGEPLWRMALRLVWKYGMAPLRVQGLMRNVVDRFLKLYDEPLFPFASLTEAAREAELLDITGTTGAEFLLKQNRIDKGYANDIVQASTRVNYAQNLPQIHALEAMVCMAAEGGAMAVQGGNWRIFAGMLAASEAHVSLETDVQSVRRRKSGGFALKTNVSVEEQSFDEVVLAAPWHAADLKFDPLPAYVPDEVDYVKLHVTLFTSPFRINPSYFGLPATDIPPTTILTTHPLESPSANLPFFSISLLRAVLNSHTTPSRTELAYKIFSPAPLTDEFLHSLLDIPDSILTTQDTSRPSKDVEPVSWIHRKVWSSYPYLPPRTAFDGPALQYNDVGDGAALYYTSGIEPFISTMETSALMGRNVAKLIADRFARDGDSKGKGGTEKSKAGAAGQAARLRVQDGHANGNDNANSEGFA